MEQGGDKEIVVQPVITLDPLKQKVELLQKKMDDLTQFITDLNEAINTIVNPSKKTELDMVPGDPIEIVKTKLHDLSGIIEEFKILQKEVDIKDTEIEKYERIMVSKIRTALTSIDTNSRASLITTNAFAVVEVFSKCLKNVNSAFETRIKRLKAAQDREEKEKKQIETTGSEWRAGPALVSGFNASIRPFTFSVHSDDDAGSEYTPSLSGSALSGSSVASSASSASLKSYELFVDPSEVSKLLNDAMDVIGNFAAVEQLDALPSLSQMSLEERELYKAHIHNIYLEMTSQRNIQRLNQLDKLSIAARIIRTRSKIKTLEEQNPNGLKGVISDIVRQSQSHTQDDTVEDTVDDTADESDPDFTPDKDLDTSDDEVSEEDEEEELIRQEQVGLILDKLIDTQTIHENVEKARIKYEEHKKALANMFSLSLATPNFEVRDTWLNILKYLVSQGEAFLPNGTLLLPLKLVNNIPKPSKLYLDYFEEQATTYTIEWERFFEFIEIIILDTLHDLPRVIDETFKSDFRKLLGYVAQGLVHKLPYGAGKEPDLMKIFRAYANNPIGDFETHVLHEIILSLCNKEQDNVIVGIKTARDSLSYCGDFNAEELTHIDIQRLIDNGYCLDNASGWTAKPMIGGLEKILSKMGSFSILLDGGSNNVCDLWFFNPQNLIFKYDLGVRAMSFHIFESVTYDDEKKAYAFNIYVRIKSRNGDNNHQYTAVHTLPLCDEQGVFKGQFRSIILQATAAKIWADLLAAVNSGELPKDALKLLVEIMLKCLGDKKIVHDMVIGPIFENGGLLPYLYSPSIEEVNKIEKQYNFTFNGYNEFVKNFNIEAKKLARDKEEPVLSGRNNADIHGTVRTRFHDLVNKFFSQSVSDQELLITYHHYIDIMFEVQEKIYGACNDRMAHASAAHLLMSLDESKDTQLPCLKYKGTAYNIHAKSFLKCCGEQLITVERLEDKSGEIVQRLHVKVLDPTQRKFHRQKSDILNKVISAAEIMACDSSVAGSMITEKSARIAMAIGRNPSKYCRDLQRQQLQVATDLTFPSEVMNVSKEPLPTVEEVNYPISESQESNYQMLLGDSQQRIDDEEIAPSPVIPFSPEQQRKRSRSSEGRSSPPFVTQLFKSDEPSNGGSKASKRTIKRQPRNKRKTRQQYSNNKKRLSSNKKSAITKKSKISRSKRTTTIKHRKLDKK